jgi:hypothetical protein
LNFFRHDLNICLTFQWRTVSYIASCWIIGLLYISIVINKINVSYFLREKPSHHDPVLRRTPRLSAMFQRHITSTLTESRRGHILTLRRCVNCQNMLNRIRWVCTKIHSLSVVSEHLYTIPLLIGLKLLWTHMNFVWTYNGLWAGVKHTVDCL